VNISVVIPAYNAAHFLPRSLKSVFAQTLEPMEVIVVDDGSSDNSAQVAKSLGAKVVTRPNGGLSAARNTGIQNASGEWIALLDADDLWAPHKLQSQAALVRGDTVLVYTGIRIFDDHGTRKTCPAVDPSATREILRYGNPITPSSVIAKRDALSRDGGFREDIRACEDWEMWVRLQRLGTFEAVPDPLTEYYVSPSSLSANPQRMIDALESIIDTTLVSDLHGLSRWAWRQRIRAVQLCSAALIARDNGLKSETRYVLRSLAAWPSPFWQPHRLLTFAATIKNQFRRGGREL
jgi:glycosyltransferase involved in cell wall biosynthesis